ncbi:fumarylacetoacetate hydrolase family protein [Arthrobacter sp. Marseille-P9274]|uniref:fumarylacetoacetate hydrolase family protein n=1 Tax=Arthrobacter sp. Marseille-P9274 TaxID=2866572 RepID=UPI0021C63CD3|nr:fumarylacetoacetate hydrolase family protein [Arthrobacter sp. Marseille-P9274]
MTVHFAIGTFHDGVSTFPGLVIDEAVYDISNVLSGVVDTATLLQGWQRNFDALSRFAEDQQRRAEVAAVPLVGLQILPPVRPMGQLLAAGANYRQHVIEITVAHRLGDPNSSEDELREQAAREVDERARTGEPYVWVGATSGVCGANDDVILPSVGSDHDWELELGVMIGSEAYQVPEGEAMGHIAGYTICNDLTTRSLVPRKDIPMMGTDWMRSKNHPTFFPTGPYLVPAAFVPDPHNLEISLALNGKVMQKGHTGDMIFSIPKLISYISSLIALRPGDMIITGSPQGNGSHWGRFLRDGDVMESTITGLGTQRNKVRGPLRN